MRNWYYEKLNDKGKLERVKINDYDGEITGKIVFNVPAYFDENPEEAWRLGYTKHIQHTKKQLREMGIEWNPLTQYLARSVRVVDEHTVEDEYHVMDKSEEAIAAGQLSMQHTSGLYYPMTREERVQIDDDDEEEWERWDWI